MDAVSSAQRDGANSNLPHRGTDGFYESTRYHVSIFHVWLAWVGFTT